jgi:hypothetical protein
MLMYYDKNEKRKQCLFCRLLFVRLTFFFLAIMMQDNIIIFNSEITSGKQTVAIKNVEANK